MFTTNLPNFSVVHLMSKRHKTKYRNTTRFVYNTYPYFQCGMPVVEVRSMLEPSDPSARQSPSGTLASAVPGSQTATVHWGLSWSLWLVSTPTWLCRICYYRMLIKTLKFIQFLSCCFLEQAFFFLDKHIRSGLWRSNNSHL
jgi:hypothetical protein